MHAHVSSPANRLALSAIALGAVWGATLGPARATPPSWPATPAVDFPRPEGIGADGGTAHGRITLGEPASSVDVQVTGTDGLKIGADNRLLIHADSLPAGEALSFDIPFRPGSGRGYVVVSIQAKFAKAGFGATSRAFSFGQENAAQIAEHSHCTRKDPEGNWIRLMNCDEPAGAAAPPSPVQPSGPGQPPPGKSHP